MREEGCHMCPENAQLFARNADKTKGKGNLLLTAACRVFP